VNNCLLHNTGPTEIDGPEAGLSNTTLSPFAEAWACFDDARKVLRVSNTSTGSTIELGDKQGRLLTFSPDGRHLASVDHNQAIRTWEMGRKKR
jgi:hypothetical protein